MSKKFQNKVVDDPLALYTILETLGEGSYGKVFKAKGRKDGKIYAIKVVHVEEGDITEVEKEIKILAQCKSKYIVKYFDSFLHQKKEDLWMVIENCEGGSACDVINILQQTLIEEQIAAVMKGTLHGLAYLHKMKKIHRDIKAGNILLTEKGDVKLTDFGVSAQLTQSVAKRQTVIGTPYWMAPEVIQETNYDEKADIWSLGITVIELGEGKVPLSHIHPMRAIFMIPNKPSPTFSNPENWSKNIKDFIAQCLKKDPKDRPSAKKLLNHPFLKNAKGGKSLQVLVDKVQQKFQEYGGRNEFFKMLKEKEKRERGSDDDSSSTSDSDSYTTSDTDSDYDMGTTKRTKTKKSKKYDSSSFSDTTSSDSDSDDGNRTIVRQKTVKKPTNNQKKKPKVSDSESSDSDSSDSDSDSSDDEIKKKPKTPKDADQEEINRFIMIFKDFPLTELQEQYDNVNKELEEKIEQIKYNFERKRLALEEVYNQKK